MSELGIPAKMRLINEALSAAGITHSFGGALALAWCVGEVRATMDIDVNLFVGVDQIDRALHALPDGIKWTEKDEEVLRRDGQARLYWGRHPVDVFFNTTEFHADAAGRVRREPLANSELPFLSCSDLAVFKTFLSRPKDWVDLEAMLLARSIEVSVVLGVLVEYLGPTDQRIARLRDLARSVEESGR
jgi:hypothetical protein